MSTKVTVTNHPVFDPCFEDLGMHDFFMLKEEPNKVFQKFNPFTLSTFLVYNTIEIGTHIDPARWLDDDQGVIPLKSINCHITVERV